MTKYDMKSRKKSAAQNLDAYDILKVKLQIYIRYYDCGVDIDFSDSIYFLQVSLVKLDHKGNRECRPH